MRRDGWILDVYMKDEYAYLWFKTLDGTAILLKDRYHPDFYLIPKIEDELDDLSQSLFTHPSVTAVSIQKKYVSINSRRARNVLRIMVDSINDLHTVIRDVENLRCHKTICNLNLPHVQRYMMDRGLPPTRKIQIDHDSNNRLRYYQVLDDEWELNPPPFTSLIFEVNDTGDIINPQDSSKKIKEINIFNDELKLEEKLSDSETAILKSFLEKVFTSDVDFLISDNISIMRLLSRARQIHPDLQLGRVKSKHSPLKESISRSMRGRVWIHIDDYLHMGITGITERCRFTYAPPRLCSSWQAGKIIDARQCYEALKSNIIIPHTSSSYKHVLTVRELTYRDRGGLILSPQVGLHENVGELDFESMFPHIIVRENISYETMTPFKIDTDRHGFLSRMTEKVLKRRLYFKHLKKRFEDGSQEYNWCEQRNHVLKMVLVCIYGYSGCFANRFNNVSAYEEINRKAREVLVKTLNIALEEGYQLIYADTDSIFVKREDAGKEDYKALASRIERKIHLPITLDHHYKFLVLLPQKADPKLEAARRYFGKLTDGRLYYRGIELRRHDTPKFLKDFQETLITILFDADDLAAIVDTQVDKAKDYVFKSYERLIDGEVNTKKLIMNKVLRKPLSQYSSILPHVAAAVQIQQRGVSTKKGETISFIYANSNHPNSMRRVLNVKLLNSEQKSYHREKYVDLLFDTAGTILGIFGFNPSHLKRSKNFHQRIAREKNI